MKKFITTFFLSALFFMSNAQNNQNTAYWPLNTFGDLTGRSVTSALGNNPSQGDILVGKTPTEWTVTPSGAFSYSVPIRIPQGTKGVEPQLSVVYNSQSGNGLAGYNWNIGGLSMISRVSKSLHHNNEVESIRMETDDRFALDGSKLFALSGTNGVDGTIYGRESESFSKIVSHGLHGNGPAWFEVELKDGTKMEYGNTSDSKDISVGVSVVQSVLTWKLNKVTDLNGNYMEYQYFWLNGQQVIEKIRYTGNAAEGVVPYNEIEFQYTKRTDTEHKFVTKFRKRQLLNNLLDKIIINNDGEHYKTYRFLYSLDDYSYLTSIVEEGGDNSGRQFIPTEFVYGATRGSGSITTSVQNGLNQEYRVGDFNGDGVSDLLRIYRSFDHNNELHYHGYDILLNDNGVFVQYGYTFIVGRVLQQTLNQNIYRHDGIGHFMLGDFNGDGKTDVTYSTVNRTDDNDNLYLTDVVIQYSACLDNSVVFVKRHYAIPNETYKFLGRRNNFIMGDFNGDGAQDLYLNLNDGHKRDFGVHHDNVYNDFILQPVLSNTFNLLSNSNASRRNELHQLSLRDKAHVIDMNGDGVAEIMQIVEMTNDNKTLVKQFDKNNSTHYIFIDDHTTTALGNWPHKRHDIKFGDFNGDGKTDILATSVDDKVNWELRLSDGVGFEYYKTIQRSTVYDADRLLVADFDADGKSDILHIEFDPTAPVSGFMTKIEISYTREVDGINEDIFFTNYSSGFNFRIHNNGFPYLLDYDGDGGVEIMASKDVQVPFISHPFNIINPNIGGYGQLIGVSSSYGEFTDIRYKSISKNDPISELRELYVKHQPTLSYPIMDFHKPLFVVDQVVFADRSGMNRTGGNAIKNKYFYEGAKAHLRGKGFLGFTKIAFEQEYIGGNESPPVTYNETEYEFNLTHYFSSVKSSFTSQITAGSQIANRVFLKNLSSTENFYTTSTKVVPGGNLIYSNRLTRTITGDNLNGRTKTIDYNYLTSNSINYQNPDQIVETVGSSSTHQVVTTTDFTYGQFGTHIPANVTSTVTSVERDGLDPAEEYLNYDFDMKGNLIWEQRTDENSTPLTEKEYDYSSNNFGLATSISETIFNHNHGVRTTQLTYSDNGRFLLQKVNPLGYVENWTYDPFSAGVATYDDIIEGNPLHSYTYDEFHRKNGEIDTYGNTIDIVREYDEQTGGDPYQADQQLFSELTSSSLTGDQKVWFDHLGRERKIESSGFSQTIYAVTNYLSRGMVKESFEPFTGVDVKNRISYEYDEFGRETQRRVTDEDGILLSQVLTTQPAHTFIVAPYTYTNRNITTTAIDLSGKSKSITTDPTGVMLSAIDDGGTLQYAYNSFGKPLEVSLNSNVLSSMEYDEFGFQTVLEELNSGKTEYNFNILGELIYQKDAKHNVTDNLEYDELGRLLEKTVAGEVFSYEYNNSGNGIGQIDAEYSQSNGISNKYYYNGDGNLISLEETIQGKIFTTGYNYSNGRLDQEQYNQTDQIKPTILDYTFTSDGYLTAVEDANGIGSGSNFYTCLEKNEKGQNTLFERINSDAMTRTYSNASLPALYTSTYYNRDFTFDNSNGNLIARKGDNALQEESFFYDIQERLKEAHLMGNPYLIMNYDASGNIMNKSDIGDYMYHPTKKNALMEVTNDFLQVKTSEQDIEYDAHHNPIRITEGNVEWFFEYGPNHQRKKVTISNTATDDVKYRYYTINAEYEYDGDDAVIYQVDYVSGDGDLVGAVVYDGGSGTSSVYAIYTDYLGSIELITDELGNTVADVSYDAWGRYRDAETWMISEEEDFQPEKPDWLWRGYTGHEHMEEFQLINMNGRLYDPYVGRMLSPDNYVQDEASTQNYNRYTYVLNNPLKYTDPTGEITVNDVIAGAAIVGGAILTATGVAAPLGGALIAGGAGYFINTVDHIQNNGASWNNASNEVGITFSTNITFNSNNGGRQNPINKSFVPIPTIQPTLSAQDRYASIKVSNDLGEYNRTQNPDPEFYYEAVDGMVFNDGSKMSKEDFVLTFNDDALANARYGGFKNGKHHINFSMGDYRPTADNIRALVIHEAYGHGVMGYGDEGKTHHKAYFAEINSAYWSKTSLSFKQGTVNKMYEYYYNETKTNILPKKYQSVWYKYQTKFKY